tara:strand:+ start:184 stop:900 length:717 start_codon:yes stop_codon:yes gene_type:complete
MKRLVLLSSIATALGLSPSLHAQEEGASSISYNMAFTTDYRYRGFSQSRNMPAFNGGFDYANDNGFYAGLWASTIRWIQDGGGDASIEVDVYAGKSGDFNESVSYDFGILQYMYPNNELDPTADTTEIYGGIGFGIASFTYYYAPTDLFGYDGTDGSQYYDLTVDLPSIAEVDISVHYGYQDIANTEDSYSDYSISFSKDIGFATVDLSIIGTDVDATFVKGKDIVKTSAILSVSKEF